MANIVVTCCQCGKSFLRSLGRINESNKFGWKTYCSHRCCGKARNSQVLLKCARLGCNQSFTRSIKSGFKPLSWYCSRSCAATVNNSKFPKRKAIVRKCLFCGKGFTSKEKFCSVSCRNKSQVISPNQVLTWIKDFYIREKRVPLKKEFTHYKAARLRFGSWNNAIRAANYRPNPVMFSHKYLAKDGDKCDSLAEKIIDDWLYKRRVVHLRNVAYPVKDKLIVDFLINNYWVEFFGLAGELKKYDRLRRKKIRLAKNLQLKFIEIYPEHLFPKNKLDEVFKQVL